MLLRARHFFLLGAFGLALVAAAPTAGFAQEPEGNQPVAEPEDAAPAEAEEDAPDEEQGEETQVRPSNAAFMDPLGRLSNILGSMHFLRTLCGDDDAGLWRDKMNELIVAQKPNEADRRILIAHFNNGYRAFESTYRQCTPAAAVATRRYLEEGAVLSRDISARYGN